MSYLLLGLAVTACASRALIFTPEEVAILQFSKHDCEAITIGHVDGQASMTETLGGDARSVAMKQLLGKAVLMGAAGVDIYDEGIQIGRDLYVINATAYHCAVPR